MPILSYDRRARITDKSSLVLLLKTPIIGNCVRYWKSVFPLRCCRKVIKQNEKRKINFFCVLKNTERSFIIYFVKQVLHAKFCLSFCTLMSGSGKRKTLLYKLRYKLKNGKGFRKFNVFNVQKSFLPSVFGK